MSWRLIFVVLVVAAGASAWGGIRLGDWLVAHGPQATVKPATPDIPTVPVLDADGKPFVPQPPQPLMDGRLAVPEEAQQVAWELPQETAAESTDNPVIAMATTTISMMEAEQIAAANGQNNLVGIADVGDLGLGAGGRNQPLQPIESQAPPPTPAAPAQPQNASWQASLRQDLQACSALGFFDRPSCAWAARNKYCEPNNAWGKVRDCPSKSF